MLDKNMSKSKYIAIFSVVALFLVLGVSYAAVAWTTRNYNIALDSSCFDINYVKGNNINKNIGMTDESVYLQNARLTMHSSMAYTTVSVELDEECTDLNGIATIKANITSLSNDFKSGGNAYNNLRYVVVEYDPSDYTNLDMNELEGDTFDILSMGYINNTGITDLHTEFIQPGEKKDFLVVFYIKEMDYIASGSFAASIDTEVRQTNEDAPVYTSIDNFTYYIGSYNNITIPEGKVLLTKYNGTDTEVNIPSKYTIDGVDYSPIVYTINSTSDSCFSGNNKITKVFFPDNILFDYYDGTNLIENSAYKLFYNCTKLTEVNTLGYFVNDLYRSFMYCESLVNVPVIPNSATKMVSTFDGCKSLVNSPEIPNSVISMTSTFSGCTSLVNAPVIPSSVTSMGSTFSGCTSLVNAPMIPSSVTSMSSTFSGCTSLVNAPVIPNTVTIMESTFSGCTSLVTAPTIPSSVTNMYGTFSGCTSLVNAPEIPNSVTNMTFTFSDCINLIGTVRINSSNVLVSSTASYHTFYNTSKAITVEVPEGSTTYTNINNNKPSNVSIVTY